MFVNCSISENQMQPQRLSVMHFDRKINQKNNTTLLNTPSHQHFFLLQILYFALTTWACFFLSATSQHWGYGQNNIAKCCFPFAHINCCVKRRQRDLSRPSTAATTLAWGQPEICCCLMLLKDLPKKSKPADWCLRCGSCLRYTDADPSWPWSNVTRF